jgi:hypothetical protein
LAQQNPGETSGQTGESHDSQVHQPQVDRALPEITNRFVVEVEYVVSPPRNPVVSVRRRVGPIRLVLRATSMTTLIRKDPATFTASVP